MYDEIEMTPISSSNIDSVGYDEDSQTLKVKFIKSGEYVYFNVEPAIFQGLRDASSVGSYFNVNIKNFYSYEKI